MTMHRFLLRLAILAVLLAPFGMIGGNRAMAEPQQAPAMAHCADAAPAEHKQAPPEACCIVVCAALPSHAERLAPPTRLAAPQAAPSLAPLRGIEPVATTPPPRP